MKIEILALESLGVRGLCCLVTTKDRKILIDPGIALGYFRYKLPPHPLQIALGERIREKIVSSWPEATDIVISHFHGDHVPLADANPYQLHIDRIAGLNPHARLWAKLSYLSSVEKKRAFSLSLVSKNKMVSSEEKEDGPLCFSGTVPHGRAENNLEKVMMTKVEEDLTFVHASDIQLLNDDAVFQIISWKPDIVLTGGPPFYLSNLPKVQMERAWHNAVILSQNVDILIIDHHLMRGSNGLKWLERLSKKTGRKIICGADYMKRERKLYEARRKELYEKIPVAEGWHKAYEEGRASTDYYRNQVKGL